ncbi:PIG-L deacetylase family protein [Nocardioides bizhenqiangii]|uniref:PIG-L family deacetylase n=1 Tax=Nocardioides bizhenqiangii TaxID=3095076 RepID=A0ABZ0ZLF3_9ACTN|nr:MULTISPECIES: PIG-L family deacetylase [unclassified Nocardioides]MDZ5620209.1 PIG-L family deacetylase [Nocardioides sp. HM23]WQQ24586.1 PIG-L family deacetylase [Nocardioides sp. HM61]
MRHAEITPPPVSSEDVARLGTVLSVWAHPDDEAYLAGALLASVTDSGQRAVCVTATRGEAADPGAGADERADLAARRTGELEAALGVLGVTEHHWLDLPDGGCADVDAERPVGRVLELLEEVRPDTVVTFGPDGFTGHPDHRAVSRWVDLALARWQRGTTLLHPVVTAEVLGLDRALDEEYGVYELGRPRVVAPDEVRVHLSLADDLLDRKVAALACQESQTAGLISGVGRDRFRNWVSVEMLAAPARARAESG